MKVALYARCSTRDKQDVTTQLMPLQDFAQHRKAEIATEYVDIGWSGGKEQRPQLDRLMDDARKKRFDAVVVARFDRFARSTKHLLKALEEFQKLGIDFVSVNESIDTTTPIGKMVFTIIAAVAEMERSLIRERVQAGVDRARRQGKTLGRPRALVDEEKIYNLVTGGQSLKSVAKQTGIARGTAKAIVLRVGAKKALSGAAKNPLPDAL